MTHPFKYAISVVTAALLFSGCGSDSKNTTSYADKVEKSGSSLPCNVLATLDDGNGEFEVRNGGYGSDSVAHATKTNYFYALTDRGPNATFTGEDEKGKKFPTPDYTPRVGLFEL